MGRRFNILSLNGGGVRGIFQAVFLRELVRVNGEHVLDNFDLLAGTSTGAIIALSLGLGLAPGKIVELYKEHLPSVFNGRALGYFRKGSRYRQKPLRRLLEQSFGTKKLEDIAPRILIPATTIDRFGHRIFSNIPELSSTDKHITAVDVALASSAAPTFFPPVRHAAGERTYMDGGLWANSPALLSALIAHKHLDIPLEDIRILSIGTGRFPEGRLPKQIANLRPLSIDTLRTLPEILLASQVSFADHYVELLIGSSQLIRADVQLREDISLDDFRSAIEVLPALAEEEAQRLQSTIRQMFPSSRGLKDDVETKQFSFVPPKVLTKELIPAAGLTAFYPSRDYYRRYREASSIDRYVSTARSSIVMVSINLMTGIPIEGLCEALVAKCNGNANFTVKISLINPKREHLMHTLAPVLDMNAHDLSEAIQISLARLKAAQSLLREEDRVRFAIRVHNAVPMGSAILLDHEEAFGRIQVESKIYKAPPRMSFAFEVVRTGVEGFYESLAKGYDDLVNDGQEWPETAVGAN